MRQWRILIISVMCCAIATFSNPIQDNPRVTTEIIPPLMVEKIQMEKNQQKYDLKLSRASRARLRDVDASVSTTTSSTAPSTIPEPPSSPPPETTVQKKVTVSTTEKPSGDIWGKLAMCESSMNQRATSSSGKYLGYFQFSMATWRSVGGPGDPRDQNYETQLKYAKILQERSGWGQWPSCSKKLGLI